MPEIFVHASAVVESESIGCGTSIWAFAHVMPHATIGENCNLGDHVFVESGARIGNNVTIKNNVCVWDGVTIQDDAFIGPQVVFTNDKFPRSRRMPEAAARYERRENWLLNTLVRQGCSIGAHATILPGVTLGEYSMIAAGSLVTRDVEPYSLVLGSPAFGVGKVCRCGRRLDELDSQACATCGFDLAACCQ